MVVLRSGQTAVQLPTQPQLPEGPPPLPPHIPRPQDDPLYEQKCELYRAHMKLEQISQSIQQLMSCVQMDNISEESKKHMKQTLMEQLDNQDKEQAKIRELSEFIRTQGKVASNQSQWTPVPSRSRSADRVSEPNPKMPKGDSSTRGRGYGGRGGGRGGSRHN